MAISVRERKSAELSLGRITMDTNTNMLVISTMKINFQAKVSLSAFRKTYWTKRNLQWRFLERIKTGKRYIQVLKRTEIWRRLSCGYKAWKWHNFQFKRHDCLRRRVQRRCSRWHRLRLRQRRKQTVEEMGKRHRCLCNRGNNWLKAL